MGSVRDSMISATEGRFSTKYWHCLTTGTAVIVRNTIDLSDLDSIKGLSIVNMTSGISSDSQLFQFRL